MVEGRIKAPELEGITAWLNSSPLTLESLKGRVVLLDFWTYTCVNCLRALPHVKKLHEKYAAKGLAVIGIHSPEFDFEKEEANVREAVKALGIKYPVALDSGMQTWNAYDNSCWPAQYVIDREGNIAYVNFGEGNQAETSRMVQKLLGIRPKAEKEKARSYLFDQSPETYAGFSRNQGLGSGLACDESGCDVYVDLDGHLPNVIYPHGRWVQEGEYLELKKAPGKLAYRFNAREANMVMAPVGEPVRAEIFVGGKKAGKVTVGRPGTYVVFAASEYGDRELEVVFYGPVRVYAYTFG
jgi:thiol-disulfide isomerase/thioredoxin